MFFNYTEDILPGFSGIAILFNLYTNFPYFSGPSTSEEELGVQNLLEWHIAHEYGGHILLGSGHHEKGIYCQRDGTCWNHQVGTVPFCTFHRLSLGWFDINHIINVTNNMFDISIGDLVTSGYVYKIENSPSDYFIVENHQRSGYDIAYPGNGLLIWHYFTGSNYADVETSDGRYYWLTETCSGGTYYSYPFMQNDANPDGKDEIDLRYVYCCENGNRVKKSHPDMKGDVEDLFNLQTQTTFAPWTNPNSNDKYGAFTDVMVKVKNIQGNNIIADLCVDAPPAAPQNLSVSGGWSENPTLIWDANSEQDFDKYYIYRWDTQKPSWKQIGNTTSTTYIDYTAMIIPAGWVIKYRIKAKDNSNNFSDYSNIVQITGETKIRVYEIPNNYSISSPSPNPFNLLATIKFGLPEDSRVELVVYDLMGRVVRTLVSGLVDAGYQHVNWDGINGEGLQVASGMYLYKLTAVSLESEKTYTKTGKMALLR